MDSISVRRSLFAVAVLALVAAALAAVASGEPRFASRSAPFASSELNIAAHSPRGPQGGVVVPASGGTTLTVTCSISAGDTSITRGRSTRLSWSSPNANWAVLSASPNHSPLPQAVNPNRGSMTVSPTRTTTYTLYVSGIRNLGGRNFEADSNTCSVRVSVSTPPPLPPPPVSADIEANGSDGPITIAYNTSATLSWSSNNATSCSVSPGGWTGTSNSGVSTGNLTSSRTYTLSCSGNGAPDDDDVTVNVNPPPPPDIILEQSKETTDPEEPFEVTYGISSSGGDASLCRLRRRPVPGTWSTIHQFDPSPGDTVDVPQTLPPPGGPTGLWRYRVRCFYSGADPIEEIDHTVRSWLDASCTAGPDPLNPVDSATWDANPSGGGGTGTYSCTWTGDASSLTPACSGTTGPYDASDAQVRRDLNASVTVTSFTQEVSNTCSTVRVRFQCDDGIDNDDPEDASDPLADFNDPACHTDGNPDSDGDGVADNLDGTFNRTINDEVDLVINADPRIIPSDGTSNISWTGRGDSCTVTENNPSPNVSDSWTGLTGSEQTSQLENETTYTLTCDAADQPTRSSSVRVIVLPTFEEF